MNRCTGCPREVEWCQIRLNPLLRVMRCVQLNPVSRILMPNHLHEDTLREYEMVIRYDDRATLREVEETVDECGLAWDSMDSERRIVCGGSVFRRRNKKGYWILRTPCIYCYRDLIDRNEPVEVLNRCTLQGRF